MTAGLYKSAQLTGIGGQEPLRRRLANFKMRGSVEGWSTETTNVLRPATLAKVLCLVSGQPTYKANTGLRPQGR